MTGNLSPYSALSSGSVAAASFTSMHVNSSSNSEQTRPSPSASPTQDEHPARVNWVTPVVAAVIAAHLSSPGSIGSASCRERVGLEGSTPQVAGSYNKN